MDENERKRKLQAGKEKLAQFQKKKQTSPEKKKKKKKTTLAEGGEKDDKSQSHQSSLTDHNDWNSSSDVHSASYEDSDQHSTTTEDLSSEELEVVSGEIARIELRRATQRIHQLEETLVGKETALEEFKTQLSQGTSISAEKTKTEDYLRQLQDFQFGITQRDEIISQLRNSLQSTVQSHDVAEGEASDQVHHLVLEVHNLKVHLQQATEELKRQTNDNSNLVTELYETKNHVLHLQQQNKEKESILQYLSDSFSKKSEELIEVKNRNHLLHVDLVKSSNEVKRLIRKAEKFEHKHTSDSSPDELTEIQKTNLDDHENEIALIKEELFVQQQLEISKISQQLQKVIDEKMILEVELINFKHKSCDLDTLESRLAALEKEKGQLEIENQEWRTKYTDLVKNNGLDRTDSCNIDSDSTLQKISMELSELKIENKNLRKEMNEEINRLNKLHLQEIEILHQEMEMANKVGLDHLSNQALELQTLLKEKNPIVETYEFEERNLLEIQFCLENNIKNLKLILDEERKERGEMEEHCQEVVKEFKAALESQINQKIPESDVRTEMEINAMSSTVLKKGMDTEKLIEELKEQHVLEMQQLEDHLQEFNEINWNRKKKEMALEFEEKLNQNSVELEYTYLQRLESIKAQKDREFVEELQKVRNELSELHDREMETQRNKLMENIIHHVGEELNSETSKFINQLIQQNQELGDAKKTLLEQLDGIHHKQDELQEEILNLSSEKEELIVENEKIKHDFKIISGHSHPSYDLEFRTKYENVKVEYEDLLAKIKVEKSLKSSDRRDIECSESIAFVSQESLNPNSDLKRKFFNLSEEFELYKMQSQSRSIDLQNSLDVILKEKNELEKKLQAFETSNWETKFLNLSKEFDLYINQNQTRSNMNDIQSSLDATLKEKNELEKKLQELETSNWKTKFHELSQEYEALRYHLQESPTEKDDFDTLQDLSPQSLADWKKKYELLSSDYCQLKTQLEMELAEPKSGMHSLLSETWSVDTQTVWETTDIETQSEDEEAVTWKEYNAKFKELTEAEKQLSNEIIILKEDMAKLEDENKELKQLPVKYVSSNQSESNVPLTTDLKVNETLSDLDVDKVDLLHELTELRVKVKKYEKWKSKFEEVAEEKLELQLVIQQLGESNLKIKFDNLSQEYNEAKAQLEQLNQPSSFIWANDTLSYKRLQEEYCELLVQKNELEEKLSEQEIKLFAIEKEQAEVEILRCERNCLEEKLFNQVNLFEQEKLELQQSNTDLQINYESLLIFKENMEKEFQTQHDKYEKMLAEARILVLETHGKEKIEVEKIILDFGATEKEINILKDHLRSEKLQKDILNSKVNILSQENISYIQRHKELNVELLNFHEKLENAWKEQEDFLKKLSAARKEISSNKHKYETELNLLREKLLADRVSEEEMQNIKVERVALLGTFAKEEGKSQDNVEKLLEKIKYLKEELESKNNDLCIENNRLKDALNMERWVVNEIKECLATIGFDSLIDVVQNVKNLIKTKSELEKENCELAMEISNLEMILKDLQDKISTSNLVSAEVQEMFGHHLTTLQKQRDGLQMEIDSWKQMQKQEVNIISEKMTLENAFKKELDLKNIALQEKSNLELVLAHQQGKSEQLLQELRHMTELLQEKDQSEKKLLLCKCFLEQDLKNAEQKLQEQENILYEKLQLAMELRRRDLNLHKREVEAREKQIEFRNCENTLKFQHQEEVKQMQFSLEQENSNHIDQIKIEVEIKHAAAIARLRWEVEQDFALRESQLFEKHAADVSSLQIKHKEQLENLRAEFETRLSELRNQPEYENFYQLGSIKLCQKGEQLGGLIELQQQHEKDLTIVRNNLDAVQQELFDNLKSKIDDMHSKELANIDQEYQLKLQDELSVLQNKLTLNFTTEIDVLKAQLEHEKAIAIIEVRENLNKGSKDDLNQLEKEWTFKLEQLEKEYKIQLEQKGHAKESSQILMQKLKERLNEEHNEAIETLTQEWDKKYVECLDQLRKETEAKEQLDFKDQQHSIIEKDNSLEVDLKTDIELILKHRETLVEQAEGMRKNLVMHESEMLELRRNVQIKFDQLVEMRTEILKHHENLQSQLTSVTADYNALNNRHEKEVKELQEKIQQLHELVPEEYENPEKYLQRQLNNLKAKLEEEHKLEMEDLRKYFEKHFEETEKNFSNEVLSLPPRLEEMESQYEKEAKETLEWYKEQLENFRLTLEIQHESEMENYKLSSDLELEKIRMELMAKYESEIVILNAKHYEELELMRIKFAEDMGKEITKVRLQCASETAKQVEIETYEIQSELERQHKEALTALRLDLKHEHEIDMDSLQSEFNIQMAVEVKRNTAELAEKYSLEMEICRQELEKEYLVKLSEEIKKVKAELEKQIEEIVDKETILKKELYAEFELKLLNLKDEYENKIRIKEENETELLKNQDRMTLETNILKKVLKESLDKWETLQNDTDKLDDSPEVLKIKKTLQHGYENQLELAKSTLTSEFDKSKELTAKEIENEQVKFMKEHQRLMDQFMSDQEKEKAALITQHLEEQKLLQEQLIKIHASAIEELKHSYEIDIENMKENHIKTINANQELWENKRLEEIKKLHSEKEKEIADLHVHHLEELENLKIQIKEDLIVEHMHKFEAITAELENNHQAELEELKRNLSKEFSESLEQMHHDLSKKEEENQYMMQVLKEDHDREIETLKKEFTEGLASELEKGLAEMKKIHLDETQAILLSNDVDKAELDEAHRKEIMELQKKWDSKHQTELQKLHIDFKQRLENLEKKHSDEDDKLLKQRDKVLAETEEKLKQFQQQKEELLSTFEKEKKVEISNLQSMALQELGDLRLKMSLLSQEKDTLVQQEVEAVQSRYQEQIFESSKHHAKLQKEITNHLEQLDKLEQEKHHLESELQNLRDRYESMMKQREREHEEGDNLVSSLQVDKSQLHQANEHILQILGEMVKNNLALEDFLNKQLAAMASENQINPNKISTHLRDRDDIPNVEPFSVGRLIVSAGGDTSQFNLTMSLLSEESAELSQRISESLFIGPNLGSETEEIIADISTRLHTAIQRLLDMFVMIRKQMKTTTKTELHLLKSTFQNGEDVEKLKHSIEELKEQLEQENKTCDYLRIELLKAEGVIKNYEGDKDSLEAIIQQQQESQQALMIEFERLNNRVHNFEDSEAVIHEDKQYLLRQRELLTQPLGKTEQELLDASVQTTPLEHQVLFQENSRLNKEKFEIQQQLEKVTQNQIHRNREIETILEEMQVENDKLAEEKMNEVLDARRQIEALEKQIRASKQFLEEQTIEREQEREEFQKELQKLQEKVKEKEKVESVEGRLAREVVFLEQQLKDKMDTVSETLVKKEQLEKELQNKIDREQQLHDTVRDLESQLDEKIKAEHELIKQIDSLKTVLTKQHEDNEELTQQLEELRAFSPSQLEDRIQHLMLQLEMMTKSEQSTRQKTNELENELKKQRTLEEELQQDKEALQQQVYKQLLQISELQAKVDEQKHNIANGDLSHKLTLFQKQLQEKMAALELREKETTDLAEELDKLREKLMEQVEEINVRETQLHTQEGYQSLLLDKKVKEVNDDNEKLNAMVKQLKEQLDSTPMPVFFQNLIDEKNQEIDHLNQQLINLQNQLKDSNKSHQAEKLAKDLENKEMELCEKTLEIERLRVTMDGMRDQDDTPQISSVIMPEQSSRMDKQNEELMDLKQLLLVREKEIEEVHKEMHIKDMDLTWLKKELERKHGEEILTLNEIKLQEDFDTVQRMLEDKQTEVIALQQELDNFRPLGDGFTHEQARLETQIRTLENEVRLREQTLEDKEELILKLNQQLEEITEKHAHTQDEMRKEISSLREVVVQRDMEVSTVLQQLHEVMQNVSFNGTSGILQQEHQEKLKEIEDMKKEMQLKETELNQLRESYHQLTSNEALYHSIGTVSHEDLEKLRDELDHYKTELILSKAASPSKSYEQQLKELKEELTKDHQRHITEIQKNAERDAVSRIEELERKHKDEIHQLKEQFQKEMSDNINLIKTELQTVYTDEIERLRDSSRRNENLELALSDSTSIPEISQRLNSEIETTARLDANIFGVLRRRQDGVGRDSSPQTDNSSSESYSEALSETSVPSALQSLLSRVHKEGMQVLTLSELQFLVSQRAATQTIDADTDVEALQKSWENEKQYLLHTIQALKDLLSKTTDSNERPSELGDGDWRGQLLQTIHHVFLKEREALVAELRTFIVSHGNVSLSEIQRIENKIRELMLHQRSALQQIHSADRTSLLSEISDLRTRLSVIRLKQQEECQKISDQLTSVEEQSNTRERQLKRQMELLEYKVQQEKVLADDLRTSLEMEKSRTIELSSLLNREKSHSADLEMELSNANIQVSRLQDSLDKEQNHIMSLCVALESEKMQTKSLTDTISQERTSFVLFQERLESEKRRIRMAHERDMQTIQELKQCVDKEKELRMELSKALEKERLASSSIHRELETAQEQHKESIHSLKNKLSGIESALSLEKIRVEELEGQEHAPTRVEFGALLRERSFNQQLRENLEAERGCQLESSLRERTSVADLQALVDLERSKTLELQTALERERYKITSLNKTLDEERNRATEELETEKAAYRQLKKTLESLQSQKQELQKQLQAEKDRAARLCNERDRFSAQLSALHEREQEKERFREEERQVERERHRKREVEREQERQKQRDFDLEIQQYRQKFQDMQRIIDELKQREKQLSRELELERSLHQKSMNILRKEEMTKESQISHSNLKNKEHISQYKCQLEFLRQQLQELVIRFQEDCAKTFPIHHDGVSQSPINEIQRLQNCASEIFIELRQLQTAIALDTESVSVLFEMPSAVKFNDRVLKQNAELIGSLSQLSQEKLELRLSLAKLEDEVWRYRQRDTQIIQSARKTLETSGSVLSAERTAWLQERNTLQNALCKADSRIIYLSTELHKTSLELDRLKEQAILGSISSDSRMDEAKIQRLYGKYLRSESFRKALVYQKKYLIILLGGFQDTEEATLSMIAKMGVYPSEQDVQRRLRHPIAFTRFRSAVRVVIAIGRMKFLVRKWRRAVRVGSPIGCGRVNVLREESLGNGIRRGNSPYSPPHTRYGAILADSMGPFKGNYSVTTAHYSREATGITPPVKEMAKSTLPDLNEKLSSMSARRSLISTSTKQAAPSTQLYKLTASSEAISQSNSSSSGFAHHLESLSHQLDHNKIINGASKTLDSSDSSSSWR